MALFIFTRLKKKKNIDKIAAAKACLITQVCEHHVEPFGIDSVQLYTC